MKHALLAAALAAIGVFAISASSEAGGRKGRPMAAADSVEHPRARYYYRKRGTRVYAYRARRGGYSYAPEDVANTYGLSRTLFGLNNSYRDPWSDRQTSSGPFDHGFFFDSGIAPRGGDSPYPN
jgi:hypothetical protein